MEILLSIKPEWAELIYRGEKIHELRKGFPLQAKKIWFYETMPIQRVSGFAYVKKIEVMTPYKIWGIIKNESWVPKKSRDRIKDYFKNVEFGFLITLKNANKLEKNLKLADFRIGMKQPPLSYFIL